MVLYLRVTNDEYELPLAVADSPRDLGRMCGVSPNAISSSIAHSKRDGYKSQWRKVTIDEEADP